ncbi:MAG: DUF87 domain-containing protein [archaeon]
MRHQLSVEEICNKLKPVFGKKIDDIYLRYAMANSREEKDDIAHILNALYHKNLTKLLDTKVLLQPPSKEVMDGGYPLAMVSYAGKKLFPFSLREHDWPRHVCISGMSGSGKTTLAFTILTNLISHDKPFLVFDWKKSFRPLLLASSEVMCFTIGNEGVTNTFRMNINQPPKGIDPKEWINVLCDLLTESFFVSYGVHKVLLETLDEAFKDYGVYEGSERYPSWENIKWYLEQRLEKTGGREAGWLESALRIASVLTFGNFGKVCNYKEKDCLTIEDLLNKKVIFELNALSNIEKRFFCEFILSYIYKLKKANNNDPSGKFDHAILVDEAHNIFLKETTHFAKESVTDMIYREMREYGTSLICLDQHISKISDTVKGNSACHIAFQQQLPPDIYDISGLMQLKDEKNFFSMLPVGSAIVKLSERYTSPFLVEVSPVKLREKVVSDEQIKERTKCHLMGIEVEKGLDPEFNKSLIHPDFEKSQVPIEVKEAKSGTDVIFVRKEVEKPHVKIEEPIKEIPKHCKVISAENTKKQIEYPLTPTQRVLYDFVDKSVRQGKSLIELENLLEDNLYEKCYTITDIGEVINYVLKKQFEAIKNPRSVITSSIQKTYKVRDPPQGSDKLDTEQEMFLSFLRTNQGQDYGTTKIYKILGLSTRKGNKIKNELLGKDLIIIKEQKNDKGWKKIIELSPAAY